MKALFLLCFAASLMAQPSISGIVVDDITAHGARVQWSASPAATASRIRWGTSSGSYPNSWPLLQNGTHTTHGWFLSGLAPATTYFFQVCSTSGSEGCSSEQTVTTLAADPGTVTLPTLPTPVADMTPPTSFTTTYTVAADCSNLQAQINAAAGENGNNNYRIVIPARTICGGRYTLPNKSGSNPTGPGVLVLTTDAVLPPNGSRLEPSMTASLPRLISNLLVPEHYQAGTPGCSDTGQVWLKSDSTNANAFLYFCTSTAGPVWTPVAMSSGTTVPATCAVGDFFYKSDTSDPRLRVHYCYEVNRFLNWHMESAANNLTPHAVLQVAPNARRWIISGIILERPTLPAAYTSLLSTTSGQGDQFMAISRCLAYTHSSNDRVSFDRVMFNGLAYPHRSQDQVCFFRGTNVQVVNSHFRNGARWRPQGAGESTPNTIFMSETGGPARIENNYFENCHGITVFHSDDVANGMMSDVVVRRNTFFEDPANNGLGVASNGQRYYRRHQLELKRGQRWLVEGNVFNGGWPAGNQGATIAITPRSVVAAEPVGVVDYFFRHNIVLWSPQPFLLTGHDDYSDNNTWATNRVAIVNNLIYATGRASDGSTRGWPSNNQFNGQLMNMGLGLQNLAVHNNAFLGVRNVEGGAEAHMLAHAGDWNIYGNSRLSFLNNIHSSLENSTQGWWGIWAWCGSDCRGTAALNFMWKSGGSASWVFAGNTTQAFRNGSFSDGNSYPASNYRTETVANITSALYQCASCGDPAAVRPLPLGIFASGSAVARGADGGNAGPDYDAMDAALGRVRGFRVLPNTITSSGATVSYFAPDSAACTIEYGTSAAPLTGTRVSDGGGARVRNVALTGLASRTLYWARLYCGQMHTAQFRTL